MLELEMLPDEEIRAWMNEELIRLEDRFLEFEITWHCDDKAHWLEIASKIHPGTYCLPLFGKILRVGTVAEANGASLPLIQSEGRKLYHRLKKDFPDLHRDLGGYNKFRRVW